MIQIEKCNTECSHFVGCSGWLCFGDFNNSKPFGLNSEKPGLVYTPKSLLSLLHMLPALTIYTITMPFLCVLSLLFLFSLDGFRAVLGETRAVVYHPMNVFRGTEYNCFSRNSCIEGK